MNQPVRVLLMEDEELVRVSIKMILESSGRIEVVADRADGIGAVELVLEHRPDVVVTEEAKPSGDVPAEDGTTRVDVVDPATPEPDNPKSKSKKDA